MYIFNYNTEQRYFFYIKYFPFQSPSIGEIQIRDTSTYFAFKIFYESFILAYNIYTAMITKPSSFKMLNFLSETNIPIPLRFVFTEVNLF